MRAGQLSYAKVRALTRVATTDNEHALMTVALAGTAAQVERFARAWRRVDEAEFGNDTRARHLRRQLAMWVDDDGMVIIRGRLAPEVGAVVQRAVEAAADRLFREGRVAPTGGSVAEEVTSAQRRADALALLAEAALATDLDTASAGDRYQVVVHVSADAPETGDDVCGRTDPKSFREEMSMVDTDSGPLHVSAETSRRLACDASVVRMVHDPDGGVLDVGRKTRSAPSAIRRALLARDRQCQFPGCTSRRCDAHHVEHWADRGVTSLENLVLLCRRHHRAVHEGGFGVVATGQGEWRFSAPNVDLLPTAPPATAVPAGVPLAEWHIPPGTLSAWDGTPLRLAWAIDVTRDRAARQAPQ